MSMTTEAQRIAVATECQHTWRWTLADGTPWTKPVLENYDPELIVGTCVKCGAVHVPVKEEWEK